MELHGNELLIMFYCNYAQYCHGLYIYPFLLLRVWLGLSLSKIKFANLNCQWHQGWMEYGNVLSIYFQHDPKVSFPSSQQAQKCVTRLLLGCIYTHTHPPPPHTHLYVHIGLYINYY